MKAAFDRLHNSTKYIYDADVDTKQFLDSVLLFPHSEEIRLALTLPNIINTILKSFLFDCYV